MAAAQAQRILFEHHLPPVRALPGDLGTLNFDGLRAGGVLAVPVAPAAAGDRGVQPRVGAVAAAARYGIDLAEFADRCQLTAQAGTIAVLDLPRLHGDQEAALGWSFVIRRIALVGIGAGEVHDLRAAGRALAGRALHGPVLTTVAAASNAAGQQAFVEGFLLGSAQPLQLRSKGGGDGGPRELVLVGDHDADAMARAELVARCATIAQRLIQLPPNVATSTAIAQLLPELEDSGLSTHVLAGSELAEHGLNALATVGAESAHPPRLAVVDYRGDGGGRLHQSHVALVGQGVTFDTGGLALHRDLDTKAKAAMSGAAVALAVAYGAALLRLPIRVTAVLPLAENAIGAHAYRPGDVVQTAGRGVEVRTTDTDGRLLLAEAMAWARTEFSPDVVVDLATVTGASGRIFAHTHGALFATDDALADQLIQAGRRAGEALWRMPLVSDYRPLLDSAVADIAEVARSSGAPSVEAALFLREFAGATRWAHLDLAPSVGTAPSTGFGTRMLLYWLDAAADGGE